MNLLLLAHRVPYPPNKGEKIRTFHHLSFLLKQGHNVTVVTPLNGNEDKEHAEQLSKKLSIPVVHLTLRSRILRLAKGMLRGQALSVANFHTAALQNKVDHLLESNTPDVLMCTSSAMAAYVLNETTMDKIRRKRIRLVMDFMDLDSLKWEQYKDRKPWPISLIYSREAKLLSRFESQILAAFDASLFVTVDEKDLLQSERHISSKVHVISNGVDTDMYYPAADNSARTDNTVANGPVLLFTGVMDYFPNEDAVIWFADEIWPQLKDKYPQAKFIVAGMRPSRKIQALDKIDGIEVTGYVEDILPYYQQADVLIAPFRLARGIQNKILQAMACGLPVITSAAGAAGIDCESGKELLIASDATDYIANIEKLVTGEDLCESIRNAGLKLVQQKYSWDAENAKLEYILSGRIADQP